MTAEFHLLFNVVLAAIFIVPLDAMAWLSYASCRSAPARRPFAAALSGRKHAGCASLAIANAARETLRMGDTVEAMLRQVMTAIMTNDRKLAGECRGWTISSIV